MWFTKNFIWLWKNSWEHLIKKSHPCWRIPFPNLRFSEKKGFVLPLLLWSEKEATWKWTPMHEDGFEIWTDFVQADFNWKQSWIWNTTLQIPGLFLLLFSLPFVSYSLDFFERIQNQMQVFKEVFFSKFRPLFFGVMMPFIHRKFPRKHANFKVFQLELHPRIFFLYLPTAAESVSPAGTVPFTAGHWKFVAGGHWCREAYIFWVIWCHGQNVEGKRHLSLRKSLQWLLKKPY